jgi:hypothetical protein
MVGLVSHRATTTIKVIERPDLDPDISSTLIADGLQSHCYVTAELMANRNVNKWVRDLTDELIYLAAGCPVGTVLERRGDIVVRRTVGQGPGRRSRRRGS